MDFIFRFNKSLLFIFLQVLICEVIIMAQMFIEIIAQIFVVITFAVD